MTIVFTAAMLKKNNLFAASVSQTRWGHLATEKIVVILVRT